MQHFVNCTSPGTIDKALPIKMQEMDLASLGLLIQCKMSSLVFVPRVSLLLKDTPKPRFKIATHTGCV